MPPLPLQTYTLQILLKRLLFKASEYLNCKTYSITENHNLTLIRPSLQVALIPYSDERLQPRHTTLKITVALVITAIIIGCLFFVFFPRHAGAVSTGTVIV